MMIQEAYVSFEVAKLLKEKGFNESCRDFYRKENEEWLHRNTYECNYFNLQMPRWEDCYSCPTHQMAMAWLREEHNIYIVFFHTNKSGWWYNITDMKDSYVFYSSEKTMCSYEEAVDASLKYILENLI